MYITTIIARALALVDFFLGQWVDVAETTDAGISNCFAFPAVEANVNACGQEFIGNLTDVVEGLVYVVPAILAGLFASGSPAV